MIIRRERYVLLDSCLLIFWPQIIHLLRESFLNNCMLDNKKNQCSISINNLFSHCQVCIVNLDWRLICFLRALTLKSLLNEYIKGLLKGPV